MESIKSKNHLTLLANVESDMSSLKTFITAVEEGGRQGRMTFHFHIFQLFLFGCFMIYANRGQCILFLSSLPLLLPVGCPRNKQTKIQFEPIQTETRSVSKQTETTLNFLKRPKYALFQTVLVGLLFVLVQSKHRSSLFWYRSETTKTNCFETNQNKPKQTGKTKIFGKKY